MTRKETFDYLVKLQKRFKANNENILKYDCKLPRVIGRNLEIEDIFNEMCKLNGFDYCIDKEMIFTEIEVEE